MAYHIEARISDNGIEWDICKMFSGGFLFPRSELLRIVAHKVDPDYKDALLAAAIEQNKKHQEEDEKELSES